MSDTPRCDAAIAFNLKHGGDGRSVSVELARDLERELAALASGQEHNAAPPNWWMIYFDDADRRPEIFTDEAAARHRYKEISVSWNAHLFVRAHSNTRDADNGLPQNAAPQGQPEASGLGPKGNASNPAGAAPDIQKLIERLRQMAVDEADKTYTTERVHTLKQAASALAALVPQEGWVRVPREPTEEMISAAYQEMGRLAPQEAGRRLWTFADIYRAMLAAVALQPQENVTGRQS